jgi:predicted SnoaL-like aldol condensation-catalyzing enzyme
MTNKDIATEFQTMIVAGKIDEAYEKYVDMTGAHHNAYFPAGFAALQTAMKENHEQFPNKQLKIQHVLEDGDMVAVHSHIILKPGEPGIIAVHLYHLENGKIAELWDCGQAIPADNPNTSGVF